jgi:hypothetical protein
MCADKKPGQITFRSIAEKNKNNNGSTLSLNKYKFNNREDKQLLFQTNALTSCFEGVLDEAERSIRSTQSDKSFSSPNKQ